MEWGYEDTIVFENPDYASAFIGVSADGRAIYDYNKMVDYLMQTDGMSYDDAVEFIDYNVVGFGGKNMPIILEMTREDMEV